VSTLLRAVTIAAATGCAAAGTPAPRQAAPPPGYHGVIVWPAGGAAGPTRISFASVWRRDGEAWVFSRADAGDGWMAAGRLAGAELEWSLTRIAGDAGVTLRFAGDADAAGTARGCGVVRGFARTGSAAAAFALTPLASPWPDATDAPVARCRAPAGSPVSQPPA
jgi:hypothetical protein